VDANPGATIFGYPVHDPQRYGVVELDGKGAVVSIQEKPAKPPGNLAIPGLYIYDGQAAAFARTLTQSSRGELEITDVHKRYMEQGTLIVRRMERGMAWLDAGTPESLLEAGTFIHAIEQRQGLKVGCPEEVALHLGYLDVDAFARSVAQLPVSAYRTYCESLLSQ
jgi:glucose-1-phosphate thymidylyltransferase